MRERRHHDLHEVGIVELVGRHVHRDPDVLGPLDRLDAGGPKHPLADRPDQPGLLRNWNELDRRHHAQTGVGPAQQRLETLHNRVGRGDHRLIDQMKLAALQRLAHRDLDVAALVGVHVQAGLVGVGRAAAGLL